MLEEIINGNYSNELSNNESVRIQILRVWFTLMVLFIHVYGENVNFAGKGIIFDTPEWLKSIKIIVSNIVSMSSVSGFFFLSALLLYKKPFFWRENIIKKCRTILIPYILISTFWILAVYVAQHTSLLAGFFSNPDLYISNWKFNDFLQAFIGSRDNHFPFLYPLWFLRDLFVMNVLAKIIDVIVRFLGKYALILFFVLFLFVDSSHIFFCDIRAICFWGIGCYFARNGYSLSTFDKLNKIFLFIVYICLIAGTFVLLDNRGIVELVVYRLSIIVGIVFWYELCTNFKGKIKSVFLRISKYCFCIYLFHEFNLTALKKISAKILPATTMFQFIEYVSIPLIVFTSCLFFSIVLDKYVPTVFYVINGSRNVNFVIHSQ